MKPAFTTAISGVKKFWENPAIWYIEFVKGRVVRRKPVALLAGIIFHQFMDELLTTGNREVALATMTERFNAAIEESEDEGLVARAKDIQKERDVLLAAGTMWQDIYAFETLGVEKAAYIDVDMTEVGWDGPLRVVGRPDHEVRVSASGGRLGHQQHRTLASNKNVDTYLEALKRNPHEGVYWHILAHKYHEEPFGTMLNLIRKVKPDVILANPSVALQQHLVFISPEQAQATLDNVRDTAITMKQMADGKLPVYQNTDNDLGAFANSPTPYLEVLSTRDVTLLDDDEKFTDAVDRYPELANIDSVN